MGWTAANRQGISHCVESGHSAQIGHSLAARLTLTLNYQIDNIRTVCLAMQQSTRQWKGLTEGVILMNIH